MDAAPPLISLIVAMARNGVIGREQALPWRLPEDLKRFRAHTLGKPILMGRKTYDSLGRPLPGRDNLVLTRDRAWSAAGVRVVHSLEEALAVARPGTELVVIGGAQIYRLALPLAQRLYLTRVHADVPGDTYFPQIDAAEWADVAHSAHPADDRHAFAITFTTLERRGAPAPQRPH